MGGALGGFMRQIYLDPKGQSIVMDNLAEPALRPGTLLPGTDATRDLQVLVRANADGVKPSEDSAGHIEARLHDAIALQCLAIHQLPTSSAGQVVLGHLKIALSAADSFVTDNKGHCVEDALEEFRLALDLSPGQRQLPRPGRDHPPGLLAVITKAQRAETRPVIERAIRLNKDEKALKEQWQVVSESP
jgi:hypothetical protein